MTVRISNLDPEQHAEGLFAAFQRPGLPCLWRFLRDGPYPSAKALRQRLQDWVSLAHVRGVVFHLEDEDRIIGMGGLIARDRPDEPSACPGHYQELAFVIFDPDFHGKPETGTGVRQLVALAFDDPATMGCLWRCDVNNIASDRFARKLGFLPYATIDDGEAKGRKRQSRLFLLSRSDWASRISA